MEVLRDGASAQYGSDAIAGVFNVILKRRTGTEITLDAGQHYETNAEVPSNISPDAMGGRGRNLVAAINTGMPVGVDGFVNVTAEYRDRGETNRAITDTLRVNPPRVVQRIGDPRARDFAAFVNTELPIGARGANVYAFGGYAYRKGNSSGFFRSVEVHERRVLDGLRRHRPGGGRVDGCVNGAISSAAELDPVERPPECHPGLGGHVDEALRRACRHRPRARRTGAARSRRRRAQKVRRALIWTSRGGPPLVMRPNAALSRFVFGFP